MSVTRQGAHAVLAGLVLLLAVESSLLHGRALQLPAADPGGELSRPRAAPGLPARVTSDAPAPGATTAIPLPDSLLPERSSQTSATIRALDAPPSSSRPADARHRPTPARGPP